MKGKLGDKKNGILTRSRTFEILIKIIGGMNREDVRSFKLFISRVNIASNRRDVELFDYIRKLGAESDEEYILQKLYSENNKNALYRLEGRLLESLYNYIGTVCSSYSESEVHMHLSISKYFSIQHQYEVAFFFLKKAEKKALQGSFFEVLDIIYSTMLKLSNHLIELDSEKYLELRRSNLEKINDLRTIEDILSIVNIRLRKSYNVSETTDDLISWLEQNIKRYHSSEKLDNNLKLKFALIEGVCKILIHKHDYKGLEKYLIDNMPSFEDDNDPTVLEQRIKAYITLINALFKNGKFKKSLKYTERLKYLLEQSGRLYFYKYLLYYYNSLIINYSEVDLAVALEKLSELEKNKQLIQSPQYDIFYNSNLLSLSFKTKDYKGSLDAVIDMYNSNIYNGLEESFKLRLNISELIVRYELNDFEFLSNKILYVKRKFRAVLKHESFEYDNQFLNLLSAIVKYKQTKYWGKTLIKIKNFSALEASDHLNEYRFIKYGLWLDDLISR